MKKHSSKKKALLIALAVIVVLILGAVGAVYGVTHGFYRSSNYTSDKDEKLYKRRGRYNC